MKGERVCWPVSPLSKSSKSCFSPNTTMSARLPSSSCSSSCVADDSDGCGDGREDEGLSAWTADTSMLADHDRVRNFLFLFLFFSNCRSPPQLFFFSCFARCLDGKEKKKKKKKKERRKKERKKRKHHTHSLARTHAHTHTRIHSHRSSKQLMFCAVGMLV